MFAYIDPTIRARLTAAGELVRVDARGRPLAADAPLADGEVALEVLGPIPMPIELDGEEVRFDWFAFVRRSQLAEAEALADALRERGEAPRFSELSPFMSVNSALVLGDPRRAERPLVRVHSSCLTGDVLGSRRCECGPQLRAALRRIHRRGDGVLVYMAGHEGRGIGLWAKAVTYLLQDAGQDTYQANRSLGLPDDSRDFADAAALLLHLLGGDRAIDLMSNNPEKLAALRRGGLSRIRARKHVAGVTDANRRYLRAKRAWGHRIDDEDLA